MFKPTIGLEIHAELSTKTKMFCNSANDPDEMRPNVNVCPICLAHPGTLPVINKEAVRHILRIGTAVGGTLSDFTEFDRKSYFYPDIPKGYQISQYEHPLIQGGELAGVAITRVHLEEDTARSIHANGKSLVDFNRAGIPLMELVTEPVIEDAETAGRFARELQLLLRTLGAGEANLEKGEMRIEANISVAKHEASSTKSETNSKLGTKVEVKNINSFRSVERAIAYEIGRQTALVEGGGKVVQETRGWNEAKQETFHQRFKEGSADYRYFPEPDLPKLYLSEILEFSSETLRASLPELPWERRERYAQLGIKTEDIEFIIAFGARGIFFDAVVQELGGGRELAVLAANYFISDCAGECGSATPTSFAKLIRMFDSKELSSRGAKDVLLIMIKQGGDPETIAKEHNLIQVHDTGLLGTVVDTVLKNEEKAVEEYKSGKIAALQYLVGKAMKESKGAGNPEALREIFLAKLNSKH
ncbi:MAG: Asp-tRNA(Asn)/Glu-tRNA(Gln) amidotransferase subunit GatB [Candidatus Parcubacteria bacterium]|nr:Asp-tRNA(Asn)/Glu-tRNA(Gln) amidotransferase subunit GatB [Candidatus Parcubacteria bacterium]